jgi:soluble lytic murein transglycosylase-like protein
MGMTVDEIKGKVIDYANGYRIFPEIALAQIARESSYNPNAVGGDGERGLGQIMPGTWDRFAPAGITFDQAFDVDYNLSTWGAYMDWLLNRYGGDYSKALQAYNGGEGHVDNGTTSQAAQNYAAAILAASQSLNVPDDFAANQPQADNTWLIWAVSIGLVALLFAFRK